MLRRLVAVSILMAGVMAGLFFTRTGIVLGAEPKSADAAAASWNREAAAKFLDERETWWQGWPRAQKDHGTVCISCHTVVPYAMVRPELRRALGDAAMTDPEKTMLASVEKRVGDWAEMAPFYSDEKYGKGKAAESRRWC
jgi:squalene-hopene/tetraprenyl-beta-curcumene cyclase